MLPADLVLAALGALRAHKLRSFLTLLGVIIGVTTMVSVIGVIAGLDAYVKNKVIRLAPDVFVLDRLGIIQSQNDLIQALKRPQLTWADFERLRDAGLPHTAQVSTRAHRTMTVKYADKHLSSVVVVGCTANFGPMFQLDTESGRFFTENEDRTAAGVAVIGADTRDELFPRLDPMGRTLTLGGLPFRIIGVFSRQGRALGLGRDNLVCVPIQVYRNNFMAAHDSLDMQVQARGGVAGLEASVDEVRSLLRAARHTSFRDPDPFGILTQDMLQDLWKQVSRAAFVLMLLVSSVTPEAYAEYRRCILDPGTVHGICEDYRASAGIDLDHDREDLAAGRKVECPMLALWGAKGVVGKVVDPLEEWRLVARDVRGNALDCGHYIPEEAPEALLAEVLPFLH